MTNHLTTRAEVSIGGVLGHQDRRFSELPSERAVRLINSASFAREGWQGYSDGVVACPWFTMYLADWDGGLVLDLHAKDWIWSLSMPAYGGVKMSDASKARHRALFYDSFSDWTRDSERHLTGSMERMIGYAIHVSVAGGLDHDLGWSDDNCDFDCVDLPHRTLEGTSDNVK